MPLAGAVTTLGVCPRPGSVEHSCGVPVGRRDGESVEYALRRATPGAFGDVAEAVERSIDAHGLVVVGAHDVHVTLATKGFRIHPVRIYEIRDAGSTGAGAGGSLRAASPDSVPGRINVFVEGGDVVVAAVRPNVITQLFPESGLEEAAADMERRVVAVVADALDEIASAHAVDVLQEDV